MSYDIHLFIPNRKENLLEQGKRSLEKEKKTQPSEEKDRIRQALVDALLALHPSLEIKNDKRGFAYGCWIGNYKVDCGVPDIDIGISTAFLALPYSANSANIFSVVQQLLEIFERHGYLAYDPQLDRLMFSSHLLQNMTNLTETGELVREFLKNNSEKIID